MQLLIRDGYDRGLEGVLKQKLRNNRIFVVTDGFNLLGRKIIHAVFPIWDKDIPLDEELFASCGGNLKYVICGECKLNCW